MDYLWTPWRYAYVSTAEKKTGCVFCDAVNAGDDEKVRIVYRGAICDEARGMSSVYSKICNVAVTDGRIVPPSVNENDDVVRFTLL